MHIEGRKRGRDGPRITLDEVVSKDLTSRCLSENMTLSWAEWRKRIHAASPD